MPPLGSITLLFALILLSHVPSGLASCRGNLCPQHEAAAKAAGLLGSPAGNLQAACVPQQYPKQGALLPVSLQGRIIDIVWITPEKEPSDHSPPKTVFALVADVDGFPGGPLWRSDYHGKADSWKDMTIELQKAIPESDTMAHAGVTKIIWNEARPERVMLLGRGRWHWVSSDSGGTFKAIQSPGNTLGFGQEIKPHPRQTDWLLAKVRRDACTTDYRSAACGHDLFISKDFGEKWENLTESSNGKVTSIRDFEWGARLPIYAGKATPDEAIFATAYTGNAAHKGFYPGWDKDLHYVVTLNLFASRLDKIIPCGNLFEIVGGKVFLAVPSECPVGPDGKARKAGSASIGSRSVTLFVSDQDGDEFVEACLPAKLEDDGYNLVHTHDNAAAFILADHAEPGSWGPTADSPTSDAYAPAYNASLHTLSLPDIYRRDFVTDFSRVEGLAGIFIANRVDPAGRTAGSRGREASYLQTRLSINGGANWDAINPPTSYRYGQCNTCSASASADQCSLHLHGPTSWFAPEGPHPNFYSLDTAPGLVIATGNVGHHLDMSPDADCTWLSRDGGLTWEDIAENTAIYEIGNHGGIIVLAAHRSEGPTDTITFSMDAGSCFHKVQLPEPMLVENIRVAPGGNSPVFIIHGTACLKTASHPGCGFTGGSVPPGKMYAIDFQEILATEWKECSAADGSSDYEAWVAPKEGACLLGMKKTYHRRSRETFCVNPAGWDPLAPAAKDEPCDCGEPDLECEFGYTRSSGANSTAVECVAMPGLSEIDTCPRLANSGYRSSSTHLRLVHGNTCKGVNEVIPDTNGRGGAKGSDPSGGGGGGGGKGDGGGGSAIRTFFLLILTGGAVAVAGGLTWTHCLNPSQRETIAEKAAPAVAILEAGFELALGLIVEVYDWIRAKMRHLPFIGSGRASNGAGGDAFGFDAVAGYEPLSGSGDGGLALDPEDHRSPPLVSHGGMP